MLKKRIVVFLLMAALPLFSQQYWKDFFFLFDPNGFDNPPYMGMKLTESQAVSSGTYTTVLMEDEEIQEALSYISSNPKYYYSFFYTEQGNPLLRKSYYVDDFMQLNPLTELYYYYDEQGLMAVSLYEYSIFDKSVKSRQFTKLRENNKLVYKDDFQLRNSQDFLSQLVKMENEINEALPVYQPLLLNNLLP